MSRALLPTSLAFQNADLVLGICPQRGQQCQKQPSTKIAKRKSGKKKSGVPLIDASFSRHAFSPERTSNIRSSCSVVLFFFPLIADIVFARTELTPRKPCLSFFLRK